LQQPQTRELIASVEERVVQALDRGAAPTPAALLFLLRRYVLADRAGVADRLGHGLAVALERPKDAMSTVDRADWLRLFVEAAHTSDDDRIPVAIAALVAALAAEWTTHADIERAGASIDACLQAADGAAAQPALVQRAIDELERVVSIAYQPGGAPRSVAQHVRLASALLTAFACTARLPYAMLAEELLQAMRRNNWDASAGVFAASPDLNCEAARVLNRLGALHRNAEYRAAAVLAPGADYHADAAGILGSLAPQLGDEGFPFAAFGLALVEHESNASET
jgi:hypothetical protein